MTEAEIKIQADQVTAAIGQPALTMSEFMSLVALINSGLDFYLALAKIMNRRGGNGDAVARLRAYAAENGVEVNLKKSVPNNVFLGAVL